MLFIQFYALAAFAQLPPAAGNDQTIPDPVDVPETESGIPLFADPNKVYGTLEINTQPTYPGGIHELLNSFKESIHCPKQAVDKKINSTVIIRFIINEDGSTSDAIVVRDPGYGCANEALRLINTMSEWTPGLYRGQPVKTYYTLPIHFDCR